MSRTHVTFCRICEASCGLLAEVEGVQVTGLKPDPEHVVSRGFACVKGTHFEAIHHSPDRVTRPQKRVGDEFVEVSWQQAISEIGARVRALRRAHGPECMGFYAGNPTPFSPLHLIFSKSFSAGLATPHVYTSASLDCNNKFVASEEMFGSPMIQPIPDLDHAHGLILIGANPLVSNMTFVNAPRIRERLAAIEARGGFVTFVNPRRTESADVLGEQCFIRPGTDVYLLLSFARELLEHRAIPARVDEACVGAAELRRAVSPWTAERTSAVTGVPADRLLAMVERFRAAQGAAVYLSTGVNQGPHGTLCSWLAHVINLVTDNVDSTGGLLVTRQMSQTARITYPHGRHIRRSRSQIGDFRMVFECEPVGIIPDQVEAKGKDQLRGLFVSAGNLVRAAPNSARMERALRGLDLLVTIDLFRNETGQLADYVLPATSFLERDDMPMGITGYQPIPYLQYVAPVVPPSGEARDEWWTLTQLARACGTPLSGSRLVQTFASLVVGGADGRSLEWRRRCARMGYRLMTWFYARSFAELRRHPHGLLLRPPSPGHFLGHGVLTDHGKVRLAPPIFVEAAAELAAGFEAESNAALEAERAKAGELRLVSRREKTSHNSWMHNVERFVRATGGTNRLEMHPEDAAARGIGEGDACVLRTDSAEIRVPVHVTDAMMKGSVSLPHGWGHREATALRVARETTGSNFNLLTRDGPAALEPLSGMARLTGVRVTCERAAPASAAAEAEVD